MWKRPVKTRARSEQQHEAEVRGHHHLRTTMCLDDGDISKATTLKMSGTARTI